MGVDEVHADGWYGEPAPGLFAGRRQIVIEILQHIAAAGFFETDGFDHFRTSLRPSAPFACEARPKGEVVSACEGSGATERKLKPEGVVTKLHKPWLLLRLLLLLCLLLQLGLCLGA